MTQHVKLCPCVRQDDDIIFDHGQQVDLALVKLCTGIRIDQHHGEAPEFPLEWLHSAINVNANGGVDWETACWEQHRALSTVAMLIRICIGSQAAKDDTLMNALVDIFW